MTELTDEAVKSLLDGATPGPWLREAQGIYADNGHKLIASVKSHDQGISWPTTEANGNIMAAAPELARALLDARAERDRAIEAVRQMHHAVCGETGFAAAVRADSGRAYPWPALDLAEEIALEVMRKDMGNV